MSAELLVDAPCVLTTDADGHPGWCARHRERHPAGTRAHALSQDPGPAGARFRALRDRYRGNGAEGESAERAALAVAGMQAQSRRGGILVSPGRPLGPGSACEELLKQRNITPRAGCSCKKIMRDMNEAGVEGCRARVAEFAGDMRRNAAFMSWETRIAASWSVAVGPALKALWAKMTGREPPEERPFYSFRALILEACDVAERHARSLPQPVQVGAAADTPPNGPATLVLAAHQAATTFAAPPRPHAAPLRWAVGLTAVPSRRRDLLPKTLESLEKAGFGGEHAPRLFVDGDRGPWDEMPHAATFRWPALAQPAPDGSGAHPRPWANWWLAAQELFMRCPDCDRYALFQDDLAAVRNLRPYLEACPFPAGGYLNLFSFLNNELVARPEAGAPGWAEAALMPPPSSLAEGSAELAAFRAQRLQCGRGALALVFDRPGLVELLRFRDAVERPLEHPALRGLARIDGGVVDSMNKLGRREWCHRPSLVQHLGATSTVSLHRDPEGNVAPKRWRAEALTFPGSDFDALDFLKDKAP